MDDNVIDFEDAKDAREIDVDQARWETTRLRLAEVMVTSGLSGGGLTTAALRALLDTLLTDEEVSPNDAKQWVERSIRSLGAFVR